MNKHDAGGFVGDRPRSTDLDNPLARKLEHFARLADDDRLQLAAALSPARTIAARADIREEGDDPRSVNVILDGWACRYRQLPNGQRQIVSLLLPGDPCDPQVFHQRRVHHAIGALTPVSLAQIRGSAMKELMAHSSALEEAFFRERLSATAIQYEWTVSLGRRSAIERLAHLFCELHARLDAVGLADGASCAMLLTQTDMANALGQTSVHINRTLKELRDMELITLRLRRLTIHDHAGLQALAMFEPTYVMDDEVGSSAQPR
ncbi:CRP-like cAMP-binding protein [Methylobacterium sp. OAE515]|uniref:Crp/Fnr family transcriptional regulator n=1 Tax=Methylobacterium sp. OAE515 TaxID=2817895 RepID=UPI001789ADDA